MKTGPDLSHKKQEVCVFNKQKNNIDPFSTIMHRVRDVYNQDNTKQSESNI